MTKRFEIEAVPAKDKTSCEGCDYLYLCIVDVNLKPLGFPDCQSESISPNGHIYKIKEIRG